MNTYPVILSDSDEIAEFFYNATGMLPDYMQLSRGLADLRIRTVELPDITLIWTRARGRARWRDQMTGDGLHIGFAIESDGPVKVFGREVSRDEAQIWMPGEQMDLILDGPNLTLDIGVEDAAVRERGWGVSGSPLQRINEKSANALIQLCVRATDLSKSLEQQQCSASSIWLEDLRDEILNALDAVIGPWMNGSAGTSKKPTRPYQLVERAGRYFDERGLDSDFKLDDLIDYLDVPRRTLFHDFRQILGVGPRQYLEIKRLHALRAKLRKSSYANHTVSELATEFGFTDLGRLSGVYRRHFGEKPSETLRFG